MPKPRDDDLFKGSVMTFGEHLEELRGCLWRAILGVVIGFVLGLFLANTIVRIVQNPMESALEAYYQKSAVDELRRINPNANQAEVDRVLKDGKVFERVFVDPHELSEALLAIYPEQTARLKLPSEMITAGDVLDAATLAKAWKQDSKPAQRIGSLLSADERRTLDDMAADSSESSHELSSLVRLLNRLLEERKLYDSEAFSEVKLESEDREQLQRAADLSTESLRHANWNLLVAAFPKTLTGPHTSLAELRIWKSIANDPRTHTKSFSGQEAFMIWLKAALIAGLVISGPWVFYQIWMFVAAGLYQNEKKFVHVFLPFSIALFLFGAFMSCFVFSPVLNFFLSFNRSMGIDPEPRITEWLHFVMFLPLGFGLAFQLPLVMLFLERIGVFTVSSYLKQWRIAVLVIWVVAAIVTPSDPISIFYLAVPLMVLFFGGVLMCKWWPSERRK